MVAVYWKEDVQQAQRQDPTDSHLFLKRHLKLPEDRHWKRNDREVDDHIHNADSKIVLGSIATMSPWNGFVPRKCKGPAEQASPQNNSNQQSSGEGHHDNTSFLESRVLKDVAVETQH